MTKRKTETLIIIDFGSQYNLLIARRVREMKVYCEVYPPNVNLAHLRSKNIKGVILSGGPASIYDKAAPKISAEILRLGVPVLGICYGMHALCQSLGGVVQRSKHREYGRMMLHLGRKSRFFKGVSRNTQTWMSHGDSVVKLPKGCFGTARTRNTRIASFEHKNGKFYAVQFHPEVQHTTEGQKFIRNFVFDICRFRGNWNIRSFINESLHTVKETVKRNHVILGLSGGVDSSVVAALLSKVLRKRLTCIFVDNGLLRKGERDEVERTFTKQFKVNLRCIDARKMFLNALRGVTDPEQKRKIIGKTFIDVFQRESKRIKNASYLAQGTLYPDVIESRSHFGGPSATIKTHHNVGGLPKSMKLKLIEPLKELFKDEVRAVGRVLGLSHRSIGRHPFPGPGLAVRIIGEVTEKAARTLQDADAIFVDELRSKKLYDQVWQAFCVFLPVQTVGVMGDHRTYENVVALRAVTSQDGMTADWADLPHSFLSHVSNRIINEVRGINRVVYDISSKPPATIEWE